MNQQPEGTKRWSCPRCDGGLAVVDYCEDGLTVVCSQCGYATSPALVCPKCGYATTAEDCMKAATWRPAAQHEGSAPN